MRRIDRLGWGGLVTYPALDSFEGGSGFGQIESGFQVFRFDHFVSSRVLFENVVGNVTGRDEDVKAVPRHEVELAVLG
jgi:hypothetical protein